ncbi:MAG: outer membrane receptor protein [Bacteroidales bacterium]|nr:outer membrane receptor protein [Bacteroidales bacterium]
MKYTILIFILTMSMSLSICAEVLRVHVTDEGGVVLADVPIYIKTATSQTQMCISDEYGYAIFVVDKGKCDVVVTHLSYEPYAQTIDVVADCSITIKMTEKQQQLREVVVTASESKKISSTSHIGRDAMQQLQPTSLSDLMELLPGGISQTPTLTQVNSPSLRETGNLSALGSKSTNSNYNTHALGTLVVVDGASLMTDANMQYTPSEEQSERNTTNRGVDLRSISTDDIESVEVVRGIPSVEYGNLTSGLMNIKKIRRATPFTARFKADGKSTLFALGKGFAIDSGANSIVNINADILFAHDDVRNPLDNYKRLNVSSRFTLQSNSDNVTYEITPAIDYSGSFDNSKSDPDLNYDNVDTYDSRYQRFGLSSGFVLTPKTNGIFKKMGANVQLSQQFDKLKREKLVSPLRAAIAPTTCDEGEYDAYLIFEQYLASLEVDGKPFSAMAKAYADFDITSHDIINTIKIGGEWSIAKNFGEGQQYDITHPLSSSGWGSRPRKYSDIPALQNLGLYVQDNTTISLHRSTINARLGLRTSQLPGLDKAYYLSNHIYVDPRINVQWTLNPRQSDGLSITLSAGFGKTTKMPTLNYLYPDPSYIDIIQLAYYNQTNPAELSRYNVMSYKMNRTNYDLRAARNTKWETRIDFSLKGNRMWICYFDERMSSGFRYSNRYAVFGYKNYKVEDGVVPTDPIPYEMCQKIDGYQIVENGSKQNKRGVEFEFTSQRIKPIYTAINISGAWFRSIYVNSRPMYYATSGVIDGVALSDKYVGLYEWNEGRENEQLSTNMMLDTQVPQLGLIFSSAVQTMWYVSTQRMRQNGVPVSYLSADDGELHTYDDAAVSENPILSQLVVNIAETAYDKYTIPIALYVNLKVTKRIRDWANVSMFANRLFDYTPDFTNNGVEIRRNVSAYFGMEITLKL